MATIQLTQGYSTIIDDDDFPELSKYNWYVSVDVKNGKPYARRAIRIDKVRTSIGLATQLMGTRGTGKQIDHADGDTLNNRRSNLRVCTPQQNQANVEKRKTNVNGFKGVYWHKGRGQWAAQIRTNGRARHLGLFSDKESAAAAYNAAAIEHFGAFARINSIPKESAAA